MTSPCGSVTGSSGIWLPFREREKHGRLNSTKRFHMPTEFKVLYVCVGGAERSETGEFWAETPLVPDFARAFDVA